jgi:hypothetical protein
VDVVLSDCNSLVNVAVLDLAHDLHSISVRATRVTYLIKIETRLARSRAELQIAMK